MHAHATHKQPIHCTSFSLQGLVALLGDSAHAMQPNLGQGGCMAIEDGYQLAVDLSGAAQRAEASGTRVHVEDILKVCRTSVRPVYECLSLPLLQSPA